jgi:hypothetical protein
MTSVNLQFKVAGRVPEVSATTFGQRTLNRESGKRIVSVKILKLTRILLKLRYALRTLEHCKFMWFACATLLVCSAVFRLLSAETQARQSVTKLV